MAYVMGEDGKMNHQIESDNSDVKLTVAIGDNQSLFRIVVNKIDGTAVYDEKEVILGKGGQLRGKITSVFVSVTDDNQDTNSTSVTLSVTNATASKPFSEDAETDNGTVDYYLTIHHS